MYIYIYIYMYIYRDTNIIKFLEDERKLVFSIAQSLNPNS